MVTFKQLPPNTRIVTQVGNELVLTKKKRSVRRFKTSKKTRDKISRAARKFKIPIITGAAIALPLAIAITEGMKPAANSEKVKAFSRNILNSYTGIDIVERNFKLSRMATGTLPLIGAMIARRSGLFKGANRALSRLKVPVSLS